MAETNSQDTSQQATETIIHSTRGIEEGTDKQPDWLGNRLNDDEEICYAKLQSRWVSCRLYSIGSLVVLVAVFLLLWLLLGLVGLMTGPQSAAGTIVVAILIAVCGLGLSSYEYLRRRNHWHAVTDDSFHKKTGIFSKQVQTVDRTKDNKVEFDQGILDRYLMNTATVTMYSAATDSEEIRLSWVADPAALRDEISNKEELK